MAAGRADILLQHVRNLAAAQTDRELSDRELLRRFDTQQDQMAFAALMQRHGPMVLRVCWGVLHHLQDAEDAFQATFLILARRAASVRWQESVANWLHGVAYHVALKARAAASRRQTHQRPSQQKSPADPQAEITLREAQALLDAELNRLPDQYRVPLVLCYLAGKTQDEAARQLGWSKSTFRRMLDRGRELLQTRLARRGVALSAALSAALLAPRAVPAALIGTTLAAALAVTAGKAVTGIVSAAVVGLVEGGLRASLGARLLTTTLLVLAATVVIGSVGLAAHLRREAKQPEAKQPQTPKPLAKDQAQPKEAKQARTDQYGDPLPPGAIARLGTLRFRHGDYIKMLAFSAERNTLISGSAESVRLWDIRTGRERRRLDHDGADFMCVTLSPDGKLLASGHGDNLLRLWDPATGKEVHPLGAASEPAFRVAFSPNGKLLATANYQNKSVSLWDLRNGKRLGQLPVEASSLVFSPDGKLLVLHGVGTKVVLRLWDVAEGKEIHQWQATSRALKAVAFSPDGKTLAWGGGDAAIHLWDPATGKEMGQLQAGEEIIAALAFSPDGKTLASGAWDGTIRFWNVATAKELRRCQGHVLKLTAVAFSPDGTMLASGDENGTIRLWQVASGKEYQPYGGGVKKVSWVGFLPDGKTLISAGGDQFSLWDATTGRELRTFADKPGSDRGTALSPDGAMLLTVDRDRVIHLWDAGTGRNVRRIVSEQPWAGSCAFSPDGRTLASNAFDAVRLWDVASGKELRRIRGLGMPLLVIFSADGKKLALVSAENGNKEFVHLWDMATGKELWRIPARAWLVDAVAFSPDGRMLALGGITLGPENITGEVRLWEAATGKELRRCTGHTLMVQTVAFSSDGRTLATGSRDKTVRLWEVATGQEREQLHGHQYWIHSLSFSPDGRLLASGCQDTTALVWDLTGRFRDGRFQPRQLAPKELASCWADLAGADAAKAYQSMRLLAASGQQAVTFLKDRLQPLVAAEPQRIASLITSLDSHSFAERAKAIQELEGLGLCAEAALRKALTRKPTLEVRQRIERLLDKEKTHRLRAVRATEALEQIGTPEARQILEKLASAAPEATLAQEAKASLDRLTKRPASPSER